MPADADCFAIYHNVNEKLKETLNSLIETITEKMLSNEPVKIDTPDDLSEAEIEFDTGEKRILFIKEMDDKKIVYYKEIGSSPITQNRSMIKHIKIINPPRSKVSHSPINSSDEIVQ